MILAITGGTGFVGGRTIDLALAQGHDVRALARRPRPERAGVTWVAGALDDAAALSELVSTADAVIHIAGAVNAPDRDAFAAANIAGTAAVVEAARVWAVRRFVHVSSLAAREPALSHYGWSKAGAEEVVCASDLDWTIVRPPGVYGPGDMEQRDLFRAARMGVVPVPPAGRVSVIHADDLARLLLALAAAPGDHDVYEPEDASGPLTYADFAAAIARGAGRPGARALPLPAVLLRTAARADRLLRRGHAKLTADRVSYMLHPDWTADPGKRPPPALWTPQIPLDTGMAETARWYRAHGLL